MIEIVSLTQWEVFVIIWKRSLWKMIFNCISIPKAKNDNWNLKICLQPHNDFISRRKKVFFTLKFLLSLITKFPPSYHSSTPTKNHWNWKSIISTKIVCNKQTENSGDLLHTAKFPFYKIKEKKLSKTEIPFNINKKRSNYSVEWFSILRLSYNENSKIYCRMVIWFKVWKNKHIIVICVCGWRKCPWNDIFLSLKM